MLLERFPSPSIIVFRKLNKSELVPNKVANSVFNQGKIGVNDLLLLDEICLKMDAQYHGSELNGVGGERNNLKRVMSVLINTFGKFYTLFL